MLTEEERLELIQRRTGGESIRSLSRSTGRSRNTVRKYLRSGGSISKRKAATKKPEKLDPYKDHIASRLEQAADGPSAAILFREVQAMGYDGGLTRVKEFVRQSLRSRAQFLPAVQDGIGTGHPTGVFGS